MQQSTGTHTRGLGLLKGQTCAVVVIILVNEDMVQDEAEQLRLQGGLWCVDQGLQNLSTPGDNLVTEYQQQVTQDGKGL